MRQGGPADLARPIAPRHAVNNDMERQNADILDHIAGALLSIEHNLELLAEHSAHQTEMLRRIVQTISSN
jgi:hypothetical protein